MDERIAEHHADRAAGIAEELARNLRSRTDPRFGSRVVTEALEVSLPALERHLRLAARPPEPPQREDDVRTCPRCGEPQGAFRLDGRLWWNGSCGAHVPTRSEAPA